MDVMGKKKKKKDPVFKFGEFWAEIKYICLKIHQASFLPYLTY